MIGGEGDGVFGDVGGSKGGVVEYGSIGGGDGVMMIVVMLL